ncbi:MAG TPA: tetratricopeptide repeat protein [Oligoflexia bacterium]|nr:tetratricopeptide repeat protein [Oligoflexia bacterium]HMR24772.1 tetratricopeptide repeat protein [Oligoflexia bacterium]
MGDFEDFFEDDELFDEEDKKNVKVEKENPVKKIDSTQQQVKPVNKNEDDDLAPGMIDLEAIEGTGGYSFDEDDEDDDEDEPQPSAPVVKQTKTNAKIEETATMTSAELPSDQLSQSQLKEEEQATKTFNHMDHDEEQIDIHQVPKNEQLDQKSNVVKQALELSEDEKQKKISTVLSKSTQSILGQNQIKTPNIENNNIKEDLFINLDENELFNDIELLQEQETPQVNDEGIDFGSDIENTTEKNIESKHHVTDIEVDIPTVNSNKDKSIRGKAEDFDAFESFLKQGEKKIDEEDSVEEISQEIIEKKSKAVVLPPWLSKLSFPKVPIRYIVIGVLCVSLGFAFFYKKTIEQMVFNRVPYTPPSEIELQQISVILSKAKQEYLYDHALSQKKAIAYLNESLLIDPRHKESLYLKALLQSQMVIDEATTKKTVKNQDALVVLDEFYSDSQELLIAEAYSLLASEQDKKSLVMFEQLNEKYPENIDVSMGLAEAFVEQGQYDAAYQVLARINTGHRRVHFLKAFSLSQLDSKRAYEIYIKSIENISAYHPKLEYLKLKVGHSNQVLGLDYVDKFDAALRKNILKYPPRLLSAVYVILSEIYLESKDTEKAVISLQNAVKNSTDHKVFFKMALLQKKMGDFKKSLESYQKAYELMPDNEEYLVAYLQALRKANEYKKAIVLADEKSDKYKDSGNFLYEYSQIKRGLLRTEEALDHLNQAKEKDNKIEYDVAIATIYMENDDYEQAYKVVGEILEKDPQNEIALIYKSKILTAYHVFGLAEKSLGSIKKPYQRVYQIYQAYADYYFATEKKSSLAQLMSEVEKSDLNGYEKDMLLAKNLLINGKFDEALERLKSHQQKNEKDLALNALIAQTYLASDKPKLAITVLEESIKIKRTDFRTLFLLGVALVKAGQLDAGIEKLILASETQSKVPNVWFELQQAHIAKDNQEKVAFYFQQTTDRNPQFLPAYISMANYYFRSNLYSKAKPLYVKIIQMAPAEKEVYYNLAVIEKFNRNTDKAKAYFKKVIQLDKNNSQAYIALGILEEEGRNVTTAQSLFEKAKQVDPRNPEPYYLLGLSYRQSGRYRIALQHFQKYLDLNPNAKDKDAIEDQITFLRKNIN